MRERRRKSPSPARSPPRRPWRSSSPHMAPSLRPPPPWLSSSVSTPPSHGLSVPLGHGARTSLGHGSIAPPPTRASLLAQRRRRSALLTKRDRPHPARSSRPPDSLLAPGRPPPYDQLCLGGALRRRCGHGVLARWTTLGDTAAGLDSSMTMGGGRIPFQHGRIWAALPSRKKKRGRE